MNRKVKKILIIAGIALLGVAAGGLIGVASETSWDHALGKDKSAGEQVALTVEGMIGATPILDGKNYSESGIFTDGTMDSKTQYTYDYTVVSTDDVTNTDALPNGISTFTKAELVIHGYEGYIDSISIDGLAGTTKDDCKVTVYVGSHRFGSEKVGKSSDDYEFDGLFLRKGDIRIVFSNADEENDISFTSITINPAE